MKISDDHRIHRSIHGNCSTGVMIAAGLLVSIAAAGPARAVDSPHPQEFQQPASWHPMSADDVRKQTLEWLSKRSPDDTVRRQVESLWASDETPSAHVSGDEDEGTAAVAPPTSEEMLARVAATFSLADPQAKALIEICRHKRDGIALPEFAWLTAAETPAWERANLQLLYGRWLAHERLYDEALVQLADLKAEEVVDPASLLFYQGVIYHHMLDKEPGAAALTRLLEQDDRLPRRYVSVARLMLADLQDLEDDSLDHIARRMHDIQRRLDLGRAGSKVRAVEDGVIASLDKLIEDLEKQAKSAGGGGAGGGAMRPSAPAPDSRIIEGKGPGLVDRKDLGHKAGWGNLPPKQRQEALQQIGKDYPAHYRDMIEQYFRKLASEEEAAER